VAPGIVGIVTGPLWVAWSGTPGRVFQPHGLEYQTVATGMTVAIRGTTSKDPRQRSIAALALRRSLGGAASVAKRMIVSSSRIAIFVRERIGETDGQPA